MTLTETELTYGSDQSTARASSINQGNYQIRNDKKSKYGKRNSCIQGLGLTVLPVLTSN